MLVALFLALTLNDITLQALSEQIQIHLRAPTSSDWCAIMWRCMRFPCTWLPARSPYGERQMPARHVQTAGMDEDAFIDEDELRRAFCKNFDLSWICRHPVDLMTPKGRIQVTVGSTFYPGTRFMDFDLAAWLEECLGDTAQACD
jgi:hypothetical protein